MTATMSPADAPAVLRDAGLPGGDAARKPSTWGLRVGVAAAVLGVLVLAVVSLFVGVTAISPSDVLTGRATDAQLLAFTSSRVPRTIALVLAGSSMAIAGLLMQLLVRNRFVEPSTVGTTEAAGLGILVITILVPGSPLIVKMLVATLFALGGTYLFLRVLRSVPLRSVVVVPLVGLILSGIIAAVSTYLAWETNLLPTLNSWLTGDFSGVVAGRYELLWIVAVCGVIAYLAANKFTIAGLGKEMATTLGLDHAKVMAVGLSLVAITSAVTVVVVGSLPFLGLVVPNLVSLAMGDYLRRSLPWVAIGGAALVLVCDIIGRVVIHPGEIPIGAVVGTLGAGVFLALLLRRSPGER